jgi:hypothetical protein
MKAIFAACEHLGNESVWLIKVCRTSLFRIGMVAGFILASSLIYKADAQTPPPAAPTKKSEVRDLSKPPMRTLSARISMLNPSWDEPQQRALGPAVEIFFGGPAAPLDRVGKALPVGSIQMTPDVAGEWKWEQANRLLFFPTSGWLPPGGYRFQIRSGSLAEGCQVADKTDFNFLQASPSLTANFYSRNYYVDPATPTLQQLVTTVDFSQPVTLEEAQRHFSVTSVTGIEIFQAGSQAQVCRSHRIRCDSIFVRP